MSNGVEVLVKDKNAENKQEQRRIKRITQYNHPLQVIPRKTLLASAVTTFINKDPAKDIFPAQLIHRNYIIKTCLTTFTYLTTLVHNKRSAISTFKTIVSVVTTESLTSLFPSDLEMNIKPTRTKFMEVKTIQPSVINNNNMYKSNLPKLEKRVDDSLENDNFEVIQPSETGHVHCPSCPCSHTKTEGLKTQYDFESIKKNSLKSTKYGPGKFEIRPTKHTAEKNTQYGPYEFESNSHSAPTDKIVEKYTEVVNEYSDEKDNSGSVEQSELLTNEQAPTPPKRKTTTNKPEKTKLEKPHKPNKNKFVVADLLKLGSLGIKGLSQLAPVLEKMTGGFMKRQDAHNSRTTSTTTTTTTTPKLVTELTPYNVDKRIDSEMESKHHNFPIYIPVDELETAESQTIFTNTTLQLNTPWHDYKHPKSHNILPPKMVHESPLVNGGIPISPGEIITANSDVIVGKPAVGGPLTLAASGIKLHNPVNPPPILDSFIAGNEEFAVKEPPPVREQTLPPRNVDDSYDLRPPEIPKPKPPKSLSRPIHPPKPHIPIRHSPPNRTPPPAAPVFPLNINEQLMKTENFDSLSSVLGNHGRPAFLDYIPSLASSTPPTTSHDIRQSEPNKELELPDNNQSSSEVIYTRVTPNGDVVPVNQSPQDSMNKQFLVDIQPSRVANVLIPHGSSTALVFAGSSEPHKTGDYVDDPLPYPEPGYFGSFSIDAPQLTNVHTTPATAKSNQGPPDLNLREMYKPSSETYKNEAKYKWKDNQKGRPNTSKLPPPTSNQERHLQIGPHITAYNPDYYLPNNNGEIEKYHRHRGKDKNKNVKEVIDKEYENFLSVPPPPPPKIQHNHEQHFEKNKRPGQKPVTHTKPIQDMKVFLNIQHPVPHNTHHGGPHHHKLQPPKPYIVINSDHQPTKVTSEIYFAAQAPPNQQTPTYTIHIPTPTPGPINNNMHNQVVHPIVNNLQPQYNIPPDHPTDNSFFDVPQSHYHEKPTYINEVSDKENNMYTVTLNTATNVASNIGEPGQVIGSSIPVSIGGSNNLNADIPVGTNFAIKVEDGNSYVAVQSERSPTVKYDENGHLPQNGIQNNNRWNATGTEVPRVEVNSEVTDKYHVSTHKPTTTVKETYGPKFSSVNSHANFPVVNDHSTSSSVKDEVKPVTENVDDIKPETQNPVSPNTQINSHGWYSNINEVKDISVEASTRKNIPLSHDFDDNNVPDFGDKITSVGKPPSDYWSQSIPHNKPNLGKPFTKTTSNRSPPINQFESNYIPHNIGNLKQPVYDIPIRDNSDETTTANITPTTDKKKVIYENSEEVYDGEESKEDNEGEVSLESMKVPVVSTSEKHEKDYHAIVTPSVTLLKDEVLDSYKENQQGQEVASLEEDNGSQTEKPFNPTKYNKTVFHSNAIQPIYDSNSHMKPRPFTVSAFNTLDHQLQQPHWQINHMLENVTNASYESNYNFNIGEEMGAHSTLKPTTNRNRYQDVDSKYKRINRPVFSLHKNNTATNNTNIITSNVHISDVKPLVVLDDQDKGSTLPSFTMSLNDFDSNKTDLITEIINLSPPPPTKDFKVTAKEETIMGMSPPPPSVPLVPLSRPTRPSVTPRPIPIRTPSPYRPKPTRGPAARPQRPTRRPVSKDEVSTYRPSLDITTSHKRPVYNRDQPSSQLLPPPRDLPTRVLTPVNDVMPTPVQPPYPPATVIFPTPVSTGWMTSSRLDFPSDSDFTPTPIHFPEVGPIPEVPVQPDMSFSERPVLSIRQDASTEENIEVSFERDVTDQPTFEKSSEVNVSSTESTPHNNENISSESSVEDTSSERNKGLFIRNRDRTRKPYPLRNEEKKTEDSVKYKLPPKPTTIIRPTRTLNRPDILYPTRINPTRKIVRPTKNTNIIKPSLIESSETFIDNEFIKATEVIADSEPTAVLDKPSIVEKTPSLADSTLLQQGNEVTIKLEPTDHAGNEIKTVDEVPIVPTKTEFKTTVVTLTKTLLEPPETVSSISYLNMTHTLTIYKTKTSLLSQAEGAVTQTLVLTNVHTTTRIDVVTEIHTEVQPTTIVETVTKHIPIPQVDPTPVLEVKKTKFALDDLTISSEENDNLIIRDSETTENIQKIEHDAENDNDTFLIVMNKSQNGGHAPPISTEVDSSDYDGITRNEQVNNNGVSQVLFGEILLAGTPYLETANVANPTGVNYGKECQPDCKASRNERCQRIDGIMKCVCRPGFARMFPDRPCKPTYTYSVKLALDSRGKQRLRFHPSLADNSSKEYQTLAVATHEGINRMIMQSDLRDVYHGVHITGFQPVEMKGDRGESFEGVINDFYVQLSDNAHESRLKEVIEKYLRNNNFSLGGTDVHAAGHFMERLDVSDFNECTNSQFHDCSEHAQCFNLRGTYTCSCLEGFADLSVNKLYPGRICSAEPIGCELCNYHGACYSRDDSRVLCECFQWYAGSTCHINLKVVLIALVTSGAALTLVLVVCAVVACTKRPQQPQQRSIVACIQAMPGLPQSTMPSKQRADRRALIAERDSGDAASGHNASLPYVPVKKHSSSGIKKHAVCAPPAHDAPPPPPAVVIPRARLHGHRDSREMSSRKQSAEVCSEEKLISYLESGATGNQEEMVQRKHSIESSYSGPKERHHKPGALVSAGFKVSTTIRGDDCRMKEDRDDLSSIHKHELEAELARYDSYRKSYSHDDNISEWTDAERRIGELTLSEARSIGGTLPASTGRAASHQEANTMAERDLGSTFLLPHVHLYKPDVTSDVSEFDSL